MIPSAFRILTAVFMALSFLPGSQADFGAYLDLLSDQTNGPFINYAVTTLIVPTTPSPQVNTLVLWPGLYTNNALVQSIIASFQDPTLPSSSNEGCSGQPGQWCAFASEFRSGSPNTNGAFVPVSPGDSLTIEYTSTDPANTWTQNVYLNGAVISTYTSMDTGTAYRWGPYVECQDGAENQVTPAHTYVNSKIVLSAPNPGFAGGLTQNGATNDGMYTPDGGTTWQINTISLQSVPCPLDGTPQRR